MKKFSELKVGDYIYKIWTISIDSPYIGKIEKIEKNEKTTDFYIRLFGNHVENINEYGMYHLLWKVLNTEIDKSKWFWKDNEESKVGITTFLNNLNSFGLGKYKYNNAKDHEHQEYELIQENILFKDFELIETSDKHLFKTSYLKWIKPSDLVLYKACYNDCPDGPYFIRHASDFYKNFTRIG